MKVKMKEVKVGTVLVADSRFTCIDSGAVLVVESNDHGELFVPCTAGRHYLDGQCDGKHYVGFEEKRK